MKTTRKIITTLMAASVLGGTVTGVALVGGGSALAAGRAHPATSRIAPALRERTVGLSQLVKNGTITRAQADAIETAMIARMTADGFGNSLTRMGQGMSRGQGLTFMSTVLSRLVTNGTISQSQATAITDSMTLRGMFGYRQGGAFSGGYGMMGNNYGNGPASGGYGMMSGF